MKVNLAYGQGHLPVELPKDRTTVIEPTPRAGLPDERSAVIRTLENPIGSRPLRDWIKPGDKLCLSFTDITRATPNDRLIPWLLQHLAHVPRENITLLNQLGTHRPNTRSELERMLTPEVVRDYRVLNHEPENLEAHVQFGAMRDGTPALINRHMVEADVRIVTGFVEPHFFAGFSGGIKGLIPGTGALKSVMSSHGAKNIGDPNATFGMTEGNPLWEELRDVALRVGPSFLLNVTLNEQRQITNVFAGDLIKAHQAGCEFVRKSAMQKVSGTVRHRGDDEQRYPGSESLSGRQGMARPRASSSRVARSSSRVNVARAFQPRVRWTNYCAAPPVRKRSLPCWRRRDSCVPNNGRRKSRL
jgi:nickel-dependent lactate racemase